MKNINVAPLFVVLTWLTLFTFVAIDNKKTINKQQTQIEELIESNNKLASNDSIGNDNVRIYERNRKFMEISDALMWNYITVNRKDKNLECHTIKSLTYIIVDNMGLEEAHYEYVGKYNGAKKPD